MRLIDADKLILHLNDYALQKSPSDVESAGDRKVSRAVYKAITDCIRAEMCIRDRSRTKHLACRISQSLFLKTALIIFTREIMTLQSMKGSC